VNRLDLQGLTEEERVLLELGLVALERTLHGKFAAVLLTLPSGAFWLLAPGSERDVAKYLATADLKALLHLVEEHIR
jgi:hypothetical protein